jgi:hypothetical protein
VGCGDVVVLGEASLELKGHVVQEGSLVYSADEPARVALEARNDIPRIAISLCAGPKTQ